MAVEGEAFLLRLAIGGRAGDDSNDRKIAWPSFPFLGLLTWMRGKRQGK